MVDSAVVPPSDYSECIECPVGARCDGSNLTGLIKVCRHMRYQHCNCINNFIITIDLEEENLMLIAFRKLEAHFSDGGIMRIV